MSLPRAFASDNTSPVHPAVLDALIAANQGAAMPYGDDPWTTRVSAWFIEQFGEGTTASVVWNGTGANIVALRALTRPFDAIVCAHHAHVNMDECGAPEMFTGCKLLDIPSDDAKVTPDQVREVAWGTGIEHMAQPRVLTIAQPTEYGTVYSRDEVAALCATARELGLRVHMDGSRIANAAASLNLPLRAFTRDAGVDVLSFGASKNGAMGAEAVVVFDPALALNLKFLRKQTTQLASKMRFLSAQFVALAENDLWLTNARRANAAAKRLADGVKDIPGVKILQKVQANAVFAMLPQGVTQRLQKDFSFYVWYESTGEVRWMTTWAHTDTDVDEFVAAIREEVVGRRS